MAFYHGAECAYGVCGGGGVGGEVGVDFGDEVGGAEWVVECGVVFVVGFFAAVV